MRRTPLTRTPMRRKARKSGDKVAPAEANYVAARDSAVGGCVMAHLDASHTCHDQFGNQIRPDGLYELDHVDNGGVGSRGANTRYNLVRLCPYAHRIKTENARMWRIHLRGYLRRVEGVSWYDEERAA